MYPTLLEKWGSGPGTPQNPRLWTDRQTDRQTDRYADRLINSHTLES
jgi:hypothetical protein